MSTQSTLTVTGFVGSSVRFSIGGPGGVPYASFRLGSTQRVYDRTAQAFRDSPTQWYTVKVWRHVAANVVQSLHKGEPVIVTGRLRAEEWTGPEGQRTSLVIEATALGHDLVFGTTRFDRTLSPAARVAVPPDEPAPDESEVTPPDDAVPVDVSALEDLPGDPEGDRDDDPDDDPDEAAALHRMRLSAGAGLPEALIA